MVTFLALKLGSSDYIGTAANLVIFSKCAVIGLYLKYITYIDGAV